MKRLLVLINVKVLIIILLLMSTCKKDDSDDIIKDIDGNIYTSVKIGTQVWMVENLKVTKYRNGDPIPNVTSLSNWANLSTGGYCNMNNSENHSAVYGRLYNWFAVNDSRNIAPKGWHVPSDEEWTILVDYLGGFDVAGGKLKETGNAHWCEPNVGATNSTGFTALPGGVRSHLYDFLEGCDWAFWWSSTSSTDETAFNRIIFDSEASINRVDNHKKSGFSVRCIKD
jgi:uncharacterized protein (TIGR02145 family)